MRPHSKCLYAPLPSGISQNWGPHESKSMTAGQGISTKQQRKIFHGGKCRKNSERKPQRKAFWKFYNACYAKDLTKHMCFFLACRLWQWAVLFHYFLSVSLPKWIVSSWRRGLGLFCLFSLSMSHNASTHSAKCTRGERNGTYRHHQRTSLHEKSMRWTVMGK